MHLPRHHHARGFLQAGLTEPDADATAYVVVAGWQLAPACAHLGVGEWVVAQPVKVRIRQFWPAHKGHGSTASNTGFGLAALARSGAEPDAAAHAICGRSERWRGSADAL